MSKIHCTLVNHCGLNYLTKFSSQKFQYNKIVNVAFTVTIDFFWKINRGIIHLVHLQKFLKK